MTSFYDKLKLSLNYEDPEFEFVNAVAVQDKFAEATVINADLALEIEEANRAVHAVDFELDQVKRQLSKLRRRILKDNFGKVKASMSAEIIDAFIEASAGSHEARFYELEALEEDLFQQRTAAKAALDQVKSRLYAFERTTTFMTEWLNYDKFRTRRQDEATRGMA